MTKITDIAGPRGWVFYDADCAFCSGFAARFRRTLRRRGFRLVPMQMPWARRRLGLRDGEPIAEMRVRDRSGLDLGGADAVIFLACRIWWAWPLCALSRVPGVRGVLRAGYRWVAAWRSCPGGACCREKSAAWPGWIGLAILPPMALLTRSSLPAWAFMWLLAGALFFGCKWLTFWRETRRPHPVDPVRAFGYLFAWPGMDAARFLGTRNAEKWTTTDTTVRSVLALTKTAFGVWLVWCAARTAAEPLLAGWIGMIGLVFFLHFGLFHLAALAWQAFGVDARPIMDAPLCATSPGDFWGRRWNGAFNRLAHDFVFRPLAKKSNVALATLVAFGVSGVLHELVISLPARGGYGLPTAYFLVQGLASLASRTRMGRRLGLGRGVRGWLFTMLVTAAPAFWLFHPPFVRRVILPFLQTIHAL